MLIVMTDELFVITNIYCKFDINIITVYNKTLK